MTAPIVVIGTGLAGFNLVKELRKHDKATPVVMLTADDGRNYSKPMLSTGFTKDKGADDLALAGPEKTAETFDITLRTGVTVTAIDPAAHAVQIGDETLRYSKLVLAWGADVFRPPLEGDALDRVYTVNDLMDYGRFREALAGKKTVLVVGGGLIGCEFANDLTNGGFKVHVVEPVGRCLPTFLPEPASLAVSSALSDLGVVFHFGPFVQRVDQSGDGVRATLSDGSTVEADLVLSAVGLRPRIALAEAAGLRVNRGICTDRSLCTSDPDIYALGDCAEVDGHVLLYVLPLMSAARALAQTLAGQDTPVSYGVMPVTIKTPACPVVCMVPPQDVQGEWQVDVDGHNVKALFHDADGQLRGYALTGEACSEKMKLNKELPPLLA
ncbi:FAD-dependent oxidoreductase [Alcanivorax sp. JB21]|uniref:FAD-dependent oxidoreductase n=1 Tax=Alcanivorax limicola TaxID=2874102 RepID=UPI001CC0B3F7|nr:FAD-dependent oxidoreductase [Alcanivorax limicola]MBZ2188773.1 FAD-dependent oxidoreductase [Alcanivorax limicola]